MENYRGRLIEPLLDLLMGSQPAVMVVGPRAAGKTTTLSRRANTVVRLDREAEAGAFRADPDAALRGLAEPILLDEWQEVPEVLGAVKRTVDQDSRPGRFLITGSVRGEIAGKTWPGTGRITRVALQAMSVREQKGKLDGPTFFDRIVEGLPLHMPSEIPDLRDYVELALRGGFPSAIELDVPIRERWLESYVNQLITFDVANLRGVQDASRLRRYLQAYAANSAGFVSEQTLLEASDVDRKTASAYEQLLADLFVVESMPAWASSQLQRLVKGPKRYFVDSSVLGSVLGVDADSVMRNSDILGRLIDTFVVSQLRAEQEVTTCRPVFHHLREHQGRNEIDLIAEIRGQRVIACEIKASASPSVSDGRHLATLRDKLGDKFVKGIVFHTGPMVFELGEKILAVPIATLWA